MYHLYLPLNVFIFPVIIKVYARYIVITFVSLFSKS